MKKIESSENEVKSSKNSFFINDIIAIIIFCFYILVDFVPNFMSYSVAEPQWIYLNILNFGVTTYLLYNGSMVVFFGHKNIFYEKIVLFYLIFIVISGVSIFATLNLDEGLITLTRYIVTLVSFFNLYLLFKDKKNIFLVLSSIISILIFIECYIGINNFIENIGNKSVVDLRHQMKNNHANKNIFAANVLVKIPFIIYCIFNTENWKKIVFSIILIFTIIIVNLLDSRAVLLGLLLEILFFCVAFYWINLKLNTLKKSLINIFIPLIVLVIGFGISVLTVRKADKKFTASDLTNIENTTSTKPVKLVNLDNTSLNIRKEYWKSGLDYVPKNPLIGCGLGNWKLVSVYYERQWKDNNSNGVHMHNDFLEVAAETGIFNGIIYLLIFVFLILKNLKTLFKSEDTSKKQRAIILIAALIGYLVDSFFNFPLSRPTMQIVFVILIVLTLTNSNEYFDSEKDNKNINIKKPLLLVMILMSMATIYSNYLMFQFYKSINLTKIDNIDLKLTADYVKSLFGKFPTIDDTATPVNDIKTRYLIKENKIKEALLSIEESNKLNPNSLYANSLKVELFDKIGKYDSAYKYSKMLYEIQPKFLLFYERYIQSLARKKDTATILKTFKTFNSKNLVAKHYSFTFSSLLNAGYDTGKGYRLIEEGYKKFPDDPILLAIRNDFSKMMTNASTTNKEQSVQKIANQTLDYNKALQFYLSEYKKNNKNFVTVENLGICYFQQKEYKEAIPYLKEVIASKSFKNGKSEYLLAACYHYLGNKGAACEMATLSNNLNYPDAKQLIQLNCK